MPIVTLTNEQQSFLLDILSHGTEVLEPLVYGQEDLSFETSEDDFDDIAFRDLISTTWNALMGVSESDVSHFVPCPECGTNDVDPDFTGADGRSVCDDCREGSHV